MRYEAWARCGEPVIHIGAWAAERGEARLKVRTTRQVPDPWQGCLRMETRMFDLPQSFWDNLCWTGGWYYEVVTWV